MDAGIAGDIEKRGKVAYNVYINLNIFARVYIQTVSMLRNHGRKS